MKVVSQRCAPPLNADRVLLCPAQAQEQNKVAQIAAAGLAALWLAAAPAMAADIPIKKKICASMP